MCASCMATAASATAAATGLRAWVTARAPAWMTPPRLRALTGALLGTAVVFAAVGGPG